MNGIEGKNEDIHVPPYLTLFAILYTIFDHIYIYHIAIFELAVFMCRAFRQWVFDLL